MAEQRNKELQRMSRKVEDKYSRLQIDHRISVRKHGEVQAQVEQYKLELEETKKLQQVQEGQLKNQLDDMNQRFQEMQLQHQGLMADLTKAHTQLRS